MGAGTARNDSKRNNFWYVNAYGATVVVVCAVVDIVGREEPWPRNRKGVACRDRRRGSATPAAANLSLGIAASCVLVRRVSRLGASRRAKALEVALIKPVLLDPLGGLVLVREVAGIALRAPPP